MTDLQIAVTVLSLFAATLLTRTLPFAMFAKRVPKAVLRLSAVLPYCAIGFLVAYSLKDIKCFSYPFGIPEAVSLAVLTVVHLWRRNALFSIGAGTAVYMLLLRYIF